MVIVEVGGGGEGGGHVFFFQLFAGYLMRKGKKKITKAIRGWRSVKLLQGKKLKSASFLWTFSLSEAPNMA